MQKNLVLDFKSHEEGSDTVSTSAASFAQVPFEEEESSPSNGQSSSPQDSDVLDKSKKIRKKRNAYQKIDDDIRLRLLEAVQRGETLKSAAKRYHVNYSSAKSIFHIFRKEGRILKKATQEKSFDINLPVGQEITLPTQFLQNYNPNQTNTLCQQLDLSQQIQSSQPHDFRAERSYSQMEEVVGCSSPFNGLSENFAELLKVRGNIRSNEDIIKTRSHMPAHPSRFNPKMSSSEHLIPKMQPNQQMCFVPKSNGNPAIRSPAEKIKQYDNFYMNYSNSPLSGNARMIREGSASNSNRCLNGEFDSFTDMLSAMQGQNLLAENLKEPAIPKLVMPGVPNVDGFERRGSFQEEITWGETLENAAFDTYKSFVDAQMILNNAFKKASLLNNLVQMQRNGSPRYLSY